MAMGHAKKDGDGKGSAKLRKWISSDGPVKVGKLLDPAFIQRLGSTVDNEEFWSEVGSIQRLFQEGDGSPGFFDDTLPSILQRCKRIESNGSAICFLNMMHHLQLLCKVTR